MTAVADAPGGQPAQGQGQGGAGNGAVASAFDWTPHLKDDADLAGWVEHKKYDGPAAVAKAARGLEKLLGGPREKLIRLPDAEDAPEWKEIHGKLGRPEKPEDYGLEGADPALLTKIHEAGLTKRQVGALVPYLREQAEASAKAAEERFEKDAADADAKLAAEWGKEYDANLQHASALAQRVRQGLGMDATQWGEVSQKLQRALGVETAVKMFAFLGRNLGEAGFVEGAADRGFGQTPAAAKAELEALEADSVHRAAKLSENKATRMAAIEKEMRLREVAFPSA